MESIHELELKENSNASANNTESSFFFFLQKSILYRG